MADSQKEYSSEDARDLFAHLVATSVDEARRTVEPHLTKDESGHLFPFSLGDNRRIKKGSPQKAINAASFLVAISQAAQLHNVGDQDGAWSTMFAAGWLSHEVITASRYEVPSNVVLAEFEQQQVRRNHSSAKGGAASKRLNTEQENLALEIIKEKQAAGVSKTASCVRAASELQRLHQISVSKDTLIRLLKRHS